MDTTNCTYPRVTDRAFIRLPVGTCNDDIRIFLGSMITIDILLGYVTYRRCLAAKDTVASVNGRQIICRKSLVILLAILNLAVYVIFGSLILTNIANVDNGWSFQVIMPLFLCFGFLVDAIDPS